MLVAFRGVEHEITEDAPFVGARLLSLGCSLKCKGCHNKPNLFNIPTEINLACDIVKEVKSNPMNEGIIFGGGEWSDQALEMLEIANKADLNGLKVMIYTGLTIDEFWYRIGKAVFSSASSDDECKLISNDDCNILYPMIGKMTLDNYIQNTYWIKAGSYDKDKLVNDNIQFDIKLASSNQKIYEIRKTEEK